MQISNQFRDSIMSESYVALMNLLKYRNENVIRRCKEDSGLNDEQAERAWEAFLQFMAVCMFKSGRASASATPTADHMWHAFLLHTEQYADFCNTYMRVFIHHEPVTDFQSPDDYFASRAYAEKIFSDLDPEIWPEKMGKIKCISMRPDSPARFN